MRYTDLWRLYGKAAGLAKQAGFDIIYVHFTAYLGEPIPFFGLESQNG